MIPLNKAGNIRKFPGDDKFAAFVANRNSIYMGSAADALNLVYRQLYINRGPQKVAVSPLTCFQALYPIIANHHIPVFLDIDPRNFNIDVASLDKCPSVNVIQVIHLSGVPVDMDAICHWAKSHEVTVVEDCAQALGAKFSGDYVGSFGDYAVYSTVKNLYTPSGGLLVTKNTMSEIPDGTIGKSLISYRRLKLLLEEGCSFDNKDFLYHSLLSLKETKKDHSLSCSAKSVSIGFSQNLTAALAYTEALNLARTRNFERYQQELSEQFIFQECPAGGEATRCRVLLRSKTGIHSMHAINYLRSKGIAANNLTQNYINSYQDHISKDVFLSKYYEPLVNYDSLHNDIFAIPNSPFISAKEISYIINTLKSL